MAEILKLIKEIPVGNLIVFGIISILIISLIFFGVYFLIRKLLENRNLSVGKDGVSIAYNKKDGSYLVSYDDIRSLVTSCVNSAIHRLSAIQGLKDQLIEKRLELIDSVYESTLNKLKLTFKNANGDNTKDSKMTILLFNQTIDSELETNLMPFLKKVINNTDYQVLSSDELMRLGIQTTQKVFNSLDNIIESNTFNNFFNEKTLKDMKTECNEDIRQYVSEAINDSVKITVTYNKNKLSLLDKLQKEINEYSKDELIKLKGDEEIEEIKINTDEI